MKHIAAMILIWAGASCASIPRAHLDGAHDAIERGKHAYKALCIPEPIDSVACEDLKQAFNAAIEMYNALPEDTE